MEERKDEIRLNKEGRSYAGCGTMQTIEMIKEWSE